MIVIDMLKNKNKIKAFLNKYFKIEGDYSISDEGIINVEGDVELLYKTFNQDGFTELPIQFGDINGDFDFKHSNITTLKGFPHIVIYCCSITGSKHLKSLEFSPECHSLTIDNCSLISFDYLNCKKLYFNDLKIEKFGDNFSVKTFEFDYFSIKPTVNEFRYLLKLNPEFVTLQDCLWLDVIKDYHQHKDMFRVAQDFEEIYGETLVKPEDRIEIINSDLTMSI